jgi:CPA1 family monovalent cation:H+ antiporter
VDGVASVFPLKNDAHLLSCTAMNPTALFGALVPSHDSPVAMLELMLVLLGAVAVLVLAARRIQVPYPILLVIGGFALSFVPGLPHIRLDPELVFVLFLPPLLYPAALFMPWRDFQANLGTILLLAVGLVLFTMVATAWFAHHYIGLGWGPGFVLGAIIAPSDAVAATAIAHRLRVPRRIVMILEGESLVNDTTAFVAYRFAIAAVVTGSFSLAGASLKFVTAGLGGTLVGLLAGGVATTIQRRLDDPPVQITLSLLTPFACYLAAESIGCSGVLAVVVCGLYYGWRAPEFIRSHLRLRAFPVWEMIEFVLNGAIFILIGLQLPDVIAALGNHSLREVLWLATVILIPVVLLRIGWVFASVYVLRGISALLRRPYDAPPWRQAALVGWTGMRGVDSLAAALAVPFVVKTGAPFPDRDLIFFLTFVVIFGTLVVQGLSLAPVIRWLHLVDDHAWEKEERKARLKANQAALARLTQIAKTKNVNQSIVQRLTAEYEDRILQLENEVAENSASSNLYSQDFQQLAQEALDMERETILQLRNRRVINDEALRRIQRDIDLAETRLHREHSET